jgi:hypothetical protein
MSKTIRIRTVPNGGDNFIKINMEQDFDFVEVLSLKISQKDLYQTFCADYGAVVGRVIVNNGFGVPNAKVSIFIPISDLDRDNDEIFSLYPFETITDVRPNGQRYNLLPNSNENIDECFTPIGDFPKKRTFLDDDRMLEIYCKYYKFTTTTNQSGDYMIFGVPAGSHTMYVEADISDIGIISQKPYDLIRKGIPIETFDSTTKFKKQSDNLNDNIHILGGNPYGVNIQPYWGSQDTCNVTISRQDINLNTTVQPHAIFMGSIFGDNEEGIINAKCRPKATLGVLSKQTTGSGTIEMIRETLDGTIERFDIAGGKLIDSDGTWAYQIPMNLDYRVTDEFGNLVPTDDPNKGIPTRARVRFRIGMDDNVGGVSRRAKYLVPHNPRRHTNGGVQPQFIVGTDEFPYGEPTIDFEFGPNTSKASLADLSWNTVYSVKNYIRRYQKTIFPSSPKIRSFVGIKDVDSASSDITPFPYNSLNVVSDPLFSFLCGLIIILTSIILGVNTFIISPINFIIGLFNSLLDWILPSIPYIACLTLECNSDDEPKYFAPGCDYQSEGCSAAAQDLGAITCVGSDTESDRPDAGYISCAIVSLLKSLDLLEFDFFNDWVNGTLYSPPFRLKNKRGRKELLTFCEWSCGGFSGYTAEGVTTSSSEPFDNACPKNTYLIQNCGLGSFPFFNDPNFTAPEYLTGCNGPYDCGDFEEDRRPFPNTEGINFVGSSLIDYGLIVNKKVEPSFSSTILTDDGVYYYAPYGRNTNDYILATDIITLGSSVDCHWLGLPSVIRFILDTTYKLPPYSSDKEFNPITNTNDIVTSGMNGLPLASQSPTSTNPNLFFTIYDCTIVLTGPLQCSNIRRQCELGIGFDELYYDATQTPPQFVAPNRVIQNEDIDINLSRNLFAWMNNYHLYTTSDPNSVDTSFVNTFVGGACGNTNGKPDYNTFRYNWKNVNDTGTLCSVKPKTYNSFYFYFGLKRQKTALSKMLEKYFSPCPVQDKPPFTIISDTKDVTTIGGVDGEITITIIGGTGPYTATITYPDGTSEDFPVIGDTITFNDLVEGSYTITVIDSSGLISTTTVIVGGPVPLNCFVESVNVSGFNSLGQSNNDGIINIEISYGAEPYTVTVAPFLFINPITGMSVYGTPVFDGPILGGSFTLPALSAGIYAVEVQDSDTISPSSCSSVIIISQPTGTTVTFDVFGVQCEGACNGYVVITLDGEPPYDITLTRVDGAVIFNDQDNNTTENSPSVTITGHISNTLSIVNLCEGDYELNVIDSSNTPTPQIDITVLPAQYTNSQLDLDNNDAIVTIDPTNNNDFNNGTGVLVVCPPIAPPSGEYVYQLYRDETSPPIQTVTSSNPCAQFVNLDCNSGNNYWISYRNHLGCRFPSNLNQRYEVIVNTGC